MIDEAACSGRKPRLSGRLVSSFTISAVLGFAACMGCSGDSSLQTCPTESGSTGSTSGTGAAGNGGTTAGSGAAGNGGAGTATGPNGYDEKVFDHFTPPPDPYDIQKQQIEEGPPEVRARLHSCSKLQYSTLGDFLMSRGVDLDATSAPGQPRTAGELYKAGKEVLGAANYHARQPEASFYTAASATKLFDLFVQAAPEIIANIQSAEACKLNGVGKPLFDASGKCVYESLSCVMGRPAKPEDLDACNLIIAQAEPGNATDLDLKRRVAVAAFLSAAHTCE